MDVFKARQANKVVVRALPAAIPEPVFWDSVKQWINDKTVDWKVFRPGKRSRIPGERDVGSRAYAHFRDGRSVHEFATVFNGHVYADKTGREYRVHVEYAPSQRIPARSAKRFQQQGSLEDSRDYKMFLDNLSNPPPLQLDEEPEFDPENTPLIAYLTRKEPAKSADRQRGKRATQKTGGDDGSRKDKKQRKDGARKDDVAAPKEAKPKRSRRDRRKKEGKKARDDQEQEQGAAAVAAPVSVGAKEKHGRKRGTRRRQKKDHKENENEKKKDPEPKTMSILQPPRAQPAGSEGARAPSAQQDKTSTAGADKAKNDQPKHKRGGRRPRGGEKGRQSTKDNTPPAPS